MVAAAAADTEAEALALAQEVTATALAKAAELAALPPSSLLLWALAVDLAEPAAAAVAGLIREKNMLLPVRQALGKREEVGIPVAVPLKKQGANTKSSKKDNANEMPLPKDGHMLRDSFKVITIWANFGIL